MLPYDGFVFDIEADALYPAVSKIWYLRITDLNDDEKYLKLFLEESFITDQDNKSFFGEDCPTKFQEFVESYEEGFLVVGHNILQYDMWVLWKLWGIQPFIGKAGKDWLFNKSCQFVDTRYLSMFLNPDLPGHSLEDWGIRVGEHKMDYRGKLIEIGVMTGDEPEGFEFSFWNHWMEKYCNQDVKTNKKIFRKMWEKLSELYPTGIPESYKISQKGFFLMGAQEFTGYKFNKELAQELEIEIAALIEEIAKEIEPQLPLRPLKKGEEKDYTMPAKPFKKDGSLSSHMLNFIEKHKAEYLGEGQIKIFEKIEVIESKKLLEVKVPMELKDQAALKDYFLELGWEPVYYNYQKDDKGKFVRDDKGKLIETTPKLQEAGKLDPGLEDLVGDIPKKVVKYLSLRNRLGVLQGWINHDRISIDGRLPARSSKITNTHRQAHSTVCNVPKAEDQVLFGKQFRSLFQAEEGFLLAAADAVAGENFTEAHYTLPYPGGEEYVNDLLSGDPHIKNACIFYPDKMKGIDITAPGVKDDPKVKPWRSKSKNGKYALTFGCSAGKLAKTLGVPEAQSKTLYANFWDGNPALKALKEAVEKYWETKGNKKYLPGLDGRMLCTRSKHSLLNVLFQSALAIIMDYALAIMDKKLGILYLDDKGRPYYIYKGYIVRRVCYYHDEASYECQEPIAEEVSQMLADAIGQAAQFLKLKVPLKGEGKTGKNWKETH